MLKQRFEMLSAMTFDKTFALEKRTPMFARNRFAAILPVALFCAAIASASTAWAADAVRTAKTTYSGTIEEITPQQITLATQGGRTETIPVNQVISVRFDGEPSQLSSARNQIAAGQFSEALQLLEPLPNDPAVTANVAIAQEVAYYQAMAAARLALASGDDAAVRAAGGDFRAWVKANPDSYHWYEANELLGDLLVALNAFDSAITYYDRVGEAPWPDVKMAAQIAKGRALLAQGDTSQAQQAFAAAEQIEGDDSDPLILRQRQSARLGKAQCLAEEQNYDDAIEAIEQVIVATDPEDAILSARAYNTLGDCLLKAARAKEALIAYLHVDVLYFTAAEEHAEALKNLAKLWVEIDQPERALQAQNMLKRRYGVQ